MADEKRIVIKKIDPDHLADISRNLASSSNIESTIKLEIGPTEVNDVKPHASPLLNFKNEGGDASSASASASVVAESENSTQSQSPAPNDEIVGSCEYYKCLMCANEERQVFFSSYERIHFHLEVEHALATQKLRENLIECEHEDNDIHCRECGKQFINGALLYQHIGVHREEQPLDSISLVTCLVCNHACSSVHGIHQHLAKAHHVNSAEERMKFIIGKLISASEKSADEMTECIFRTCRYCHKYFTQAKNMRAHMLTVHSDIVKPSDLAKKYQCIKCSSSFNVPLGLSTHVKRKHPSNRDRYLCCICLDKLPCDGTNGIREHYKSHRIQNSTSSGSGETEEPFSKRTKTC